MKELVSILRAADTAARWHVHQRRKGIAQEPYINHLLEVASLVTEATGGSDPALVCASAVAWHCDGRGAIANDRGRCRRLQLYGSDSTNWLLNSICMSHQMGE